MLDIDHFKKFNTDHGHPVANKVLEMVGNILTTNVKSTDLVGRYGGEEFVLVLNRAPLNIACDVAERIRMRVAAARLPLGNGGSLSVTVSLGVTSTSILSTNSITLETLLEQANAAMRRAKEAGRNRVSSIIES